MCGNRKLAADAKHWFRKAWPGMDREGPLGRPREEATERTRVQKTGGLGKGDARAGQETLPWCHAPKIADPMTHKALSVLGFEQVDKKSRKEWPAFGSWCLLVRQETGRPGMTATGSLKQENRSRLTEEPPEPLLTWLVGPETQPCNTGGEQRGQEAVAAKGATGRENCQTDRQTARLRERAKEAKKHAPQPPAVHSYRLPAIGTSYARSMHANARPNVHSGHPLSLAAATFCQSAASAVFTGRHRARDGKGGGGGGRGGKKKKEKREEKEK